MNFLNRLCNFINKRLLKLGALSIIALMIIATGNVVLRVIEIPYRGAYEIVSFLGALVTAFSLGYMQRQKDHITVDILSSRYLESMRNLLDRINYLVMSVFFGVPTLK